MSRIVHRDIVTAISKSTRIPTRIVDDVLKAFYEATMAFVLLDGLVSITKFGSFKKRINKSRRTLNGKMSKPSVSVRFRVSKGSKAMEKFGVVLDDDKTKTASEGHKCPSCSAELVSLDPPMCKNCGTEPFEKKAQDGGF